MANVPNLRTFQPMASKAKNMEDTDLFNTTARETPDTVKATNTMEEEVVSHPKFGPLGAKGRE